MLQVFNRKRSAALNWEGGGIGTVVFQPSNQPRFETSFRNYAFSLADNPTLLNKVTASNVTHLDASPYRSISSSQCCWNIQEPSSLTLYLPVHPTEGAVFVITDGYQAQGFSSCFARTSAGMTRNVDMITPSRELIYSTNLGYYIPKYWLCAYYQSTNNGFDAKRYKAAATGDRYAYAPFLQGNLNINPGLPAETWLVRTNSAEVYELLLKEPLSDALFQRTTLDQDKIRPAGIGFASDLIALIE